MPPFWQLACAGVVSYVLVLPSGAFSFVSAQLCPGLVIRTFGPHIKGGPDHASRWSDARTTSGLPIISQADLSSLGQAKQRS
jgi:hypothetical protein